MKLKKIYLWPASLAVIFMSSIIIIVSPVSQKTLITVPTPTPAKYSCPKTEWIDCMPGPGTPKTQCQKDYLDWAKTNCINFKGAAL